MNNRLIKTFLNIYFIVLLVIGAISGIILFPFQTGIIHSIFFPKESTFNYIDISEIVCYYIALIGYFVAVILLFVAKKKYYCSSSFKKPLLLGGIILVLSSFLFLISNIVFALLIRLISFEVIYALLGLFGLSTGLAIIFLAIFSQSSK